MYIAIYVTVIVLLCAGAIAFFVFKDKKNQKLGEKLKQKAREESKLEMKQDSVLGKEIATKIEELDASKEDVTQQTDSELENFSLEFEDEKKKPKCKFDLDPFNLDGEFTWDHKDEKNGQNAKEDDGFEELKSFDDDEEIDDDDIDKKFKEYEEFLKRNLDLDDDDLNDDDLNDDEFINSNDRNFDESAKNPPPRQAQNLDNDDLKALQEFDYDSLKGKSEEEIKQIIGDLPPKAREILLNDILSRRDFDEEE